MLDRIKKYINDRMMQLPEGIEIIREVAVKPFSLMIFPVTVDIYNYITSGVESDLSNKIPVVNVTWKEAVRFCNLLSLSIGLAPCYNFSDNMNLVTFDRKQSGFRLPTDVEWQYACRAGVKGYRYADLDDIAWYEGNSSGHIHTVGENALMIGDYMI